MENTGTNISFKRIQQLALPAIIAGISEPVLSSTDAAIVGNIANEGTASLAAAGIVGGLLSAIVWILGQTRSAISAIVSQNLGSGTISTLKTFPGQAMFANLVLSIIIVLIAFSLTAPILHMLNAKGEIFDLSKTYYEIRIWGIPLTLFMHTMFGLFRGFQNTFWPMVIAAIGTVLNIGLDVVLVYGIDGYLPAMNIEGAAWASLISQFVMAALALFFILKKTNVSLKPRLKKLHPEMKRLIPMSLNLFLRATALNVALILATRQAAALGKEAAAAHAIAINVWLFTAFFIDGYGAAGNILGGKLLGEKNYSALWKLTKRVNTYNFIVALMLVALSLIFYSKIGVIFNKDPLVLTIFEGIFYLVIISLPFNSIAFTMDSIFKGMGEMAYLRNVLLGATLIVFIPLVIVSHYANWGLSGVWIALISWVAYRGFALIIKYRKKYIPLIQTSH